MNTIPESLNLTANKLMEREAKRLSHLQSQQPTKYSHMPNIPPKISPGNNHQTLKIQRKYNWIIHFKMVAKFQHFKTAHA